MSMKWHVSDTIRSPIMCSSKNQLLFLVFSMWRSIKLSFLYSTFANWPKWNVHRHIAFFIHLPLSRPYVSRTVTYYLRFINSNVGNKKHPRLLCNKLDLQIYLVKEPGFAQVVYHSQANKIALKNITDYTIIFCIQRSYTSCRYRVFSNK